MKHYMLMILSSLCKMLQRYSTCCFICSLWLPVASFLEARLCRWCTAPVTSKLMLILLTSTGWQAESTHLVLFQRPGRGSNSRPEDLKPANLTIKPTPDLSQHMTDHYCAAHKEFWLINCHKPKITIVRLQSSFMIDSTSLQQVENFKYLGSYASSSCSIYYEIESH